MDRKKIFLVSHNALSLHSNNGKTLNSLFSEWDNSNLAQLYFQDEIPESKSFDKFFRVRDLDILKHIITFGRIGSCGGTMLPRLKVTSHYENAATLKTSILAFLRSNDTLKLIIRDMVYGTGCWRSPKLFQWLTDFCPDSVFFVGGNSRFSFSIAKKISRKFGIPLDIYITDDYVINPQPKNWLAKILKRRLLNEYHSAFKEARNVFVIGDDMAEAFQREFSRTLIPVMNVVTMPPTLSKEDYSLRCVGAVDIVYAGGLHLGRDSSLAEFGDLLQRIAKNTGLNITLSVYSLQEPTKKYAKRYKELGVQFAGSLSHELIAQRFFEADFVLHIESFDEAYVNTTKLSISTKIPEYLASGTCIICFGPSSISSVRLIENNKLGVCLTEKDTTEIMESKIAAVISSSDLRQSFARKGFEFAKSRFDVEVSRRNFVAILDK